MNQFAAPNYVWLARVAIVVVLLAALSLFMANAGKFAPYLGLALILASLVLALAVRGLARQLTRQNLQVRDIQQQAEAAQDRVSRTSTILGDTDHRIGNALATLSSLLALQAHRTSDPEAREALDAARSRVHAVASAHRRLRLGADLETANMAELLNGVLEDLALSGAVQLAGEFEPLGIDPRHATTLAILLGELVNQARAHGSAQQHRGTIRVRLQRDESGVPSLQVSDASSGAGDADPRNTGFGSLVIRQLAAQLGGEPITNRLPAGGLQVSIKLPILLDPSGAQS